MSELMHGSPKRERGVLPTPRSRFGFPTRSRALRLTLAVMRAILVIGLAAQVLVAHGCHGDDVDHELFTNAVVQP